MAPALSFGAPTEQTAQTSQGPFGATENKGGSGIFSKPAETAAPAKSGIFGAPSAA